jgi:hypothetical protein
MQVVVELYTYCGHWVLLYGGYGPLGLRLRDQVTPSTRYLRTGSFLSLSCVPRYTELARLRAQCHLPR